MAGKTRTFDSPDFEGTQSLGGQGKLNPDRERVAPVIRGYEDFHFIDSGAMGEVWKAMHKVTRQIVAIKILPGDRLHRKKNKAKFEREIVTAASLEHENIGRVFDGGLEEDLCFYAMEYVEGVPFDEYVRGNQLNERQIIERLCDCLRAMQYAHDKGVIHRDLKPGNIMVNGEGVPKVLDFGLAKSMSDALVGDSDKPDPEDLPPNLIDTADYFSSMPGEVIGTPIYMSSEQARGEIDQLDGRTDIYSLGTVLYEMLIGQFPYDLSGGIAGLLQAKRVQRPRDPKDYNPDLDPDLAAIILKSIEPYKSRRYDSAGAFADDLQRYLDGRPVEANPLGLAGRTKKFVRRNRTALAASALLLMAAVGAGGYYISETMETRRKQAEAHAASEEAARRTAAAAEEREAAAAARIKAEADSRMAAQKILDEKAAAFSNDLVEVNQLIDSEELDLAEARLNELGARMLENENAGVEAQRPALDAALARFSDMRESMRNREAQLGMTIQALDVLLQENNPLTPDFADRFLTAHKPLARRPFIATNPVVQEKLSGLRDRFVLLADPVLSSEQNIDQRGARLMQMQMLLEHEGIRALLARDSRLADRMAEEQSHFILGIDNTTPYPMECSLPGQAQPLRIEAETAWQSRLIAAGEILLELRPGDDRFEPLTTNVLAAAGSGQMLRIEIFARKKIRLAAPDLPEEYRMYWADNRSGPWNELREPIQRLPGSVFVQTHRPDHLPVLEQLDLTLAQRNVTAPLPTADRWQPETYVATWQQAAAKQQAGDLEGALKILRPVDLSRLAGSAYREKFEQLIRELQGDPRLLFDRQVPVIEARVYPLLASMVQLHDPLGSLLKPFRFSPDAIVPPMELAEFSAAQEQLLGSAEQVARYRAARAWKLAAEGVHSAGELRRRARQSLAAFLRDSGGLSATVTQRVKVEQAIVDKPNRKGYAPNDLSGEEPLVRLWNAHAAFKRESVSDAAAALHNLAQYRQSGRKLDASDALLAMVSAHRVIDNNVHPLLQVGLTVDTRGYAEERGSIERAYVNLQAAFSGVASEDLLAACKRLPGYRKFGDFSDMYLLMPYAVSTMPESKVGAEARQTAKAVYDQYDAAIRKQASKSELDKIDRRLNVIDICTQRARR